MSNKLLFVTFFNCHGKEYTSQLKNNIEFNAKYNVVNIALYDYLHGHCHGHRTELIENHVNMMQKADVLLIQNLKNNRNILNTDELIKKYCKMNCTVIKIPHYTFSGYEYEYNVLDDAEMLFEKTNVEIMNHLTTLYKNDEIKIKNFLENEFHDLKILDEFSDVKMHDFVKSSFNEHRLFHARGYPTYIFFYQVSKHLLNILNIKNTHNILYTGTFKYLEIPILPNVAKFLNIQFPLYKVNKTINMIDYFLAKKKLNEPSLIEKKSFYTIQQIHNDRIQLQLS